MGWRVLVIEDDPSLSTLVGLWLEEAGMHVTRASSVEQALEHIVMKNFGFDLLLADVNLPGTSGDSLVLRIRRHHPDIRAVVMSGSHRPASLPERTVFLPKPFSDKELQSAISDAMR